MTNHFKSAQVDSIHLDPEEVGRVLKVEPELTYDVQDYVMSRIQKGFEGDYKKVKAQYGALAAGDLDKVAKNKKDERFRLNLASKNQLKIEDEERRIVEERVQKILEDERHKAYTEAFQVGLEEGRVQGRDESLREFRTQSEARLNQLDTFLAQLENHRVRLFEANERYLYELTVRMTQKVILRELKGDTKYIERLAKAVIERIGTKDQVRILLSESDAATISEIRQNLLRDEPDLRNLKIEHSADVHGGGCFIETQWTFVDASVMRQIDGIFNAMVGQAPEGEKTAVMDFSVADAPVAATAVETAPAAPMPASPTSPSSDEEATGDSENDPTEDGK